MLSRIIPNSCRQSKSEPMITMNYFHDAINIHNNFACRWTSVPGGNFHIIASFFIFPVLHKDTPLQHCIIFTHLLKQFQCLWCSSYQSYQMHYLVNSPFTFRGNIFQCSVLPHFTNLAHSHALAVIATLHLTTALTLSPRYVNSFTVFPLFHITFLPAPISLQYSLHIFCM